MARKLYCRKCGDDWKLAPPDIKDGYISRKVFLETEVPGISCDDCGNEIPQGEIAVAITYRRNTDPVIRGWEHEYGKVIPDDAVRLADKLTKD